MWNEEQKRERFQHLRRRESEGDTLTPEEQTELTAFIKEIEEAEARYLRPANERVRAEYTTVEEQNRALRGLVEREEALVARLQAVLTELQKERREIHEEKARILGSANATPMADTKA